MADQDTLVGMQLGNYKLTTLLGKGGMSTVYAARQSTVNRMVAIKLLPRALMHDETFMRRFRREAEVVANLEHFHILPIYDYGEFDGMPYIVMRYIDGGSARDLLRRGPMAWQDVVRITSQVANALDYAHQQGVVHRDVKPSNILLDAQGNAYLVDFGIAKISQDTNDITASGIVGTPAYMAPEQSNSDTPTPAADIYSLGVTAFEMITGRGPFAAADTPIAQILMHIQSPAPSLQSFNPDISDGVDAVLLRAMAKTPEARHSTAGAMASALQQAAEATSGWYWSEESLARLSDDGTTMPVLASAATFQDAIPDASETIQPVRADYQPALESPSRLSGLVIAIVVTTVALLVAVALYVNNLFGREAVAGEPSPAPEVQAQTASTEEALQTSTEVQVIEESAAPTEEAVAVQPNVPTPTASVEPTATSLPPSLFLRGVQMVRVPSGLFLMGRNDGYANERPEHTVALDDFYIDTTEVTNRDYKSCVESVDEGSCPERGLNEIGSPTNIRYYDYEPFENFPVILVTWNEADIYCRWRGGHLPTEAQWEKAARWNPETRESSLFPWGTSVLDPFYANYGNVFSNPTAVRSYESGVSAVGAYDMAGNVSEWVFDWYQDNYYETALTLNPSGPTDGIFKIIRGGDFTQSGSPLTTTYREIYRPATRLQSVGFRCAWTPGGDPTTGT